MALPLDSVSAFEAIVGNTQGFPAGFPPSCFLHQVSQIITDETVAREELEVARVGHLVRQLDLGAELGVLLVRERDYVHTVLNGQAGDEATMRIAHRFATKVVARCSDLCLSKASLAELMGGADSRLQVLLGLGFLAYHPRSGEGDAGGEGVLVFSLPGLREFGKQVLGGRKDILGFMRRGTKNERGGGVLVSTLVGMKALAHSSLSVEFHVKDLLGLGLVRSQPTASRGALLFLV